MFWLYVSALPALEAADELRMMRAVAAAIGVTFGGEEGQKAAQEIVSDLERRALPPGASA